MRIEHDKIKNPNYIYVSLYPSLKLISLQGFRTNYHDFHKAGLLTIGVWNVKYKKL